MINIKILLILTTLVLATPSYAQEEVKEVLSVHTSDHVWIEQMIKAKCNYNVNIVKTNDNIIYTDGTGSSRGLRVECPINGLPKESSGSNSFSLSFKPPTTNEAGETITNSVNRYIIFFTGVVSLDFSATMKSCYDDTPESCGSSSPTVLFENP